MLAEGSFSNKGLKIEINPRDGILIKRFVEALKLNPRWVYLRRQSDNRSKKVYKSLVLEIFNKEFIDNFLKGAESLYVENINIKNMIVGKKSELIRFPDNRPLDQLKAGLLGFFDGDGSHSGEVARIGNIM